VGSLPKKFSLSKIEKLGGNKPAPNQAQKQDAEYQNYVEERQSSAPFDEATLPF